MTNVVWFLMRNAMKLPKRLALRNLLWLSAQNVTTPGLPGPGRRTILLHLPDSLRTLSLLINTK